MVLFERETLVNKKIAFPGVPVYLLIALGPGKGI